MRSALWTAAGSPSYSGVKWLGLVLGLLLLVAAIRAMFGRRR